MMKNAAPVKSAAKVRNGGSGAAGTPILLRISPALGGLATASIVILLAAGPLSPEGDMTLSTGSFQPVKEPVEQDIISDLEDVGADLPDSVEECGARITRGWIMFCLRDEGNRCTTKVHDNELWVKNTQQCWIPQSVIRFESMTLELSEPQGTSAGEDLAVVATNAWDEYRRSVEKSELAELQVLFDQQRWRDLESRAMAFKADGTIYSEDGVRFTDLRIADALSAQLEASIVEIEPRIMSLELDVESIEGVYMSMVERDRLYLEFQIKALELNRELDKFVEGLSSWKELSGIIEFKFRASKQRLVDLHSRVLRKLAALAVARYSSVLQGKSDNRLGQFETHVAGGVARRYPELAKWRSLTRGCTYSIESAVWEGEKLVVSFYPVRAGMPVSDAPQKLAFEWKGASFGMMPVVAWRAW